MKQSLRVAAAAAFVCTLLSASPAVAAGPSSVPDSVVSTDTVSYLPDTGIAVRRDTTDSTVADSMALLDSTAAGTTAAAAGDSAEPALVTDSAFFELDFIHNGTEADAADLLEALPGAVVRQYGVHGLGGHLLVNGRYARADDLLLDGLPVLAAMPDLPDVTLLPYFNLRAMQRGYAGADLETEYDARVIPFMRVTYQASNFLPMLPIDNRWQQAGGIIAWRFMPAGMVQGYYRSVLSEAVGRDDVNFDDITTTHLGAAAEYTFGGRLLVRGHIAEVFREHSAAVASERVRTLKFTDIVRSGVVLADTVLGLRLNQGIATYINQPYWQTDTPFGAYTGMRYDGNAQWRRHFTSHAQSIGVSAGWQYERLTDAGALLRERTAVHSSVQYGLQPGRLLKITAAAGVFAHEDGSVPEAGITLAAPDAGGIRYRAAYALQAQEPTLSERFGTDTGNRFHTYGDSTLQSWQEHRLSVAGGLGTPHLESDAEVFVTMADGMVEPGYRDSVIVMTAYNEALLAGLNLDGGWHIGKWSVNGQYQLLGIAESAGTELYHRPVHSGRIVCSRTGVYKDGKVYWTLRSVLNGQGTCTGYSLAQRRTVEIPAFARADIATVVRIMDIRITYALENIFDTAYRYYAGFPMPGRTHQMTVDWDFWN